MNRVFFGQYVDCGKETAQKFHIYIIMKCCRAKTEKRRRRSTHQYVVAVATLGMTPIIKMKSIYKNTLGTVFDCTLGEFCFDSSTTCSCCCCCCFCTNGCRRRCRLCCCCCFRREWLLVYTYVFCDKKKLVKFFAHTTTSEALKPIQTLTLTLTISRFSTYS